jgi:hypothetical protein
MEPQKNVTMMPAYPPLPGVLPAILLQLHQTESLPLCCFSSWKEEERGHAQGCHNDISSLPSCSTLRPKSTQLAAVHSAHRQLDVLISMVSAQMTAKYNQLFLR